MYKIECSSFLYANTLCAFKNRRPLMVKKKGLCPNGFVSFLP